MTDAMIKWHKSKLLERMYINIEGGKKIAMPRYFKDKIYSDRERADIAIHAKNESFFRDQEFEQEMLDKYGDDWYRMKVELDMYSFNKMYRDAEKNRNKI